MTDNPKPPRIAPPNRNRRLAWIVGLGVMLVGGLFLVFQALGEGQIGLGDQTINFLVQPEIFRGENNGIKVPVRIKGPWSKLRIYPDLEFLAKQELAAQEAELKAAAQARLEEEKRRAEERLKQQAADALNLDVQEGQSLEDAARDKVEDELRRGLGNLLGGN